MSSMNAPVDVDVTYYVFGCILTVLPIIFLTLYMIILYLLTTRTKEFNTPFYKQLFHMGLTDVVQLLIFLLSGIVVLLQYDLPDGLNKVLGAVGNWCLLSWIAFSFSISVNRCITFCFPDKCSTFYSKKRLQYQILVCWVSGLPTLLMCLSPYCAIKFFRHKFAWLYDADTEYDNVARLYDLYWTTFLLCLSLINYGFIVFEIKAMKKKISNSPTQRNHEVRVCVQAFCLCLYTTLVQLHWYFKDYYMPNAKQFYFLSNMVGVINCGMNPVLCVTLNVTVKTAFVNFISGKNKECKVFTSRVPSRISK